MSELVPFPWQRKHWDSILEANHVGRVHHAMLLSGPMGIGLEHFLKCLTTSLLCESLGDQFHACGDCRSCQLNHSKSHPDLFVIKPKEANKQINIGEIRELISFIHLKAQYQQYKISVIFMADTMNRHAANALLKILEEPPQQSLLILLSHQPNLLPITIKSRCQKIKFSPAFDSKTVTWVQQSVASNEDAKHLLALAGGAPLMIDEILENNILEHKNNILQDILRFSTKEENPVKVTEKWQAYGASQILLWMIQLLPDLVRIKLSATPIRISDPETITCLQVLVNKLEFGQLLLLYDTLLEKYSLSISSTSYNTQGLLEDVIICWQCVIGKMVNHQNKRQTI